MGNCFVSDCVGIIQGARMTWEEAAIPLALLSVLYSIYLTYRMYTMGDKDDG